MTTYGPFVDLDGVDEEIEALAVTLDTATTKGDLFVATGAGTVVRVGVGSNGQVLTAKSSVAAGLDWEPVAGGAGGLLAANNLSDVANAATARGNLGLLSAATHASTDFDAAGTAAAVTTTTIGAVPTSAVGANSGVAGLDSGGKVPTSQLPAVVLGALEYQGNYDASGGSFPSSPAKGNYWVISVAGTLGSVAYKVNDWLTYDGTTWDKIDNQQTVSSVFGRVGAITSSSGDYSVGQVTGAAPLASPAFTGHPTGITESPLDNSTRLASTAYADMAVASEALARKGQGFYVEDYGAKADGRFIADAVIAGGSLSNLAATTTTPFVSTDVGKHIDITISQSGSKPVIHSTTILTFTDSGHVVLAAAAPAAVTNGFCVFGTDNTSAINTCIAAAITFAQGVFGATWDFGTCLAYVQFRAGIYLCDTAPVAGTNHNYALINYPVTLAVDRKVQLLLKGYGSASYAHWLQQTPQLDGTVICTGLNAATPDGTYGTPTILGGPSSYSGGEGANDKFDNKLVIVDGITVSSPKNAGWQGMDFSLTASAQMVQYRCNAMVPTVSSGTTPNLVAQPTNSNEIGLIMPGQSNNDISMIGSYTAEGIYYGCSISEHFNADRLGFLYCNTGVFGNISNTAIHGASIRYIGAEFTKFPFWIQGGSSSSYPLNVSMLDCESITGISGFAHIYDGNGAAYGEIVFSDYQVTDPTVTVNATNRNLKVKNFRRGTGALASAPAAIPATTVALPPTYYAPGGFAAVMVNNGTATVTAVFIDSVQVLSGPGLVMLPNGHSISVTYTGGTPTWSWIML